MAYSLNKIIGWFTYIASNSSSMLLFTARFESYLEHIISQQDPIFQLSVFMLIRTNQAAVVLLLASFSMLLCYKDYHLKAPSGLILAGSL